MHSQQLIIGTRSSKIQSFEVNALVTPAMTLCLFPTRAINENVAHRLRGSAKEMRAIVKRGILRTNQSQPCFVYQRCWLERLAGILLSHFESRESPQFVIHECEQLRGGFGIASFNGG